MNFYNPFKSSSETVVPEGWLPLIWQYTFLLYMSIYRRQPVPLRFEAV